MPSIRCHLRIWFKSERRHEMNLFVLPQILTWTAILALQSASASSLRSTCSEKFGVEQLKCFLGTTHQTHEADGGDGMPSVCRDFVEIWCVTNLVDTQTKEEKTHFRYFFGGKLFSMDLLREVAAERQFDGMEAAAE